MINNGEAQLEQAMTGVDPATREELRLIVDNSLEEARDIVADIIDKLRRVCILFNNDIENIIQTITLPRSCLAYPQTLSRLPRIQTTLFV